MTHDLAADVAKMNMEEQLQDSATILKAKGPSSKEFVSPVML